MVTTTSGLDVSVNPAITGRTIPGLGPCPKSPTEALKFYRERLGEALAGAQDAFKNARAQLATANTNLDAVKTDLDKLLAGNPDPTTPSSLTELTDSLGGLRPGADREQLEQRAAQAFNVNIVNGVLYPSGSDDLNGLRALAQSVGITADNCDLSLMGAVVGVADAGAGGAGTAGSTTGSGVVTGGGSGTAGGVGVGNAAAVAAAADGTSSIAGADDGFLFVTTQTETVERVVGSTCGEDIVEFEVVEKPLGTNVSIASAAESGGISQDDVAVNLFWLDEVRTDPAALRRLKGLGLTAEELGAAVTGQNAGRLTGRTVSTQVIQSLRVRLTDEEICTLLSRPDTGGITLLPTFEQLLSAITEALNRNTGSNRNRAGTDTEATEGGAGQGDNGPILFAALLDWFRTFNIVAPGLTELSIYMQVAITDEGVELEDEVFPTVPRPEGAGVTECETVLSLVTESITALDVLLQEARSFFADLYSSVGLGANQVSAGVGLATCLASFSLGLDFSIDISIGLPFLFEAFLASFTALLAGVVAAMAAFKLVVCQPQAIIQLLYGGVCGFKPFDFRGCPPNLSDLVDRLQNILNVVLSLTGKLTSATRTMKADFAYSASAALELRNFNPCVLAATAIAIALGLDNEEPIVTATSSVDSTLG